MNELYDILNRLKNSGRNWELDFASRSDAGWYITIREVNKQKIALPEIFTVFTGAWEIVEARYNEDSATWNSWYIDLRREVTA